MEDVGLEPAVKERGSYGWSESVVSCQSEKMW